MKTLQLIADLNDQYDWLLNPTFELNPNQLSLKDSVEQIIENLQYQWDNT